MRTSTCYSQMTFPRAITAERDESGWGGPNDWHCIEKVEMGNEGAVQQISDDGGMDSGWGKFNGWRESGPA